MNIIVLFSGNGSNLENLICHFHNKTVAKTLCKVIPVTNNPKAPGIQRAAAHGIESIVLDHKKTDSKEAFDTKLVKIVQSHEPSLVVLAGFMRILSPIFTDRIKAVNLHPSLLPLFKGTHALERSFTSGMKVGGVTIHWVNQEVDSGTIIDQVCVNIDPHDTIESFTQKIHAAEHQLLPKVIRNLLHQMQANPA